MHNESIVGQILGGLSLELKERFSSYRVELCELDEIPAIKFQDLWVVINDDVLSIVQTSPASYRFPDLLARNVVHKYWSTGNVHSQFFDILFEYSFVEPDADFEPLFKVLDNLPAYSTLRDHHSHH